VLKDGHCQRVWLRDYRGKPVVLNFWATWCAPCRAEMPLLAEAENDYKSRGLRLSGHLSITQKPEMRFVILSSTFRSVFSIWYGATGDDPDKLGLGNAAPATAFLDSEGRVVARILGQIRKQELIDRLKWLAGRPECAHTGNPGETSR
jgi:thiol-disulfide isomerase/thioredoxin